MADLNAINYLNLVGYILNAFITFLASPIFGFPDNGELSDKYQSIITPSGLTFSIWGIIFISQAIFTIVQMFPKYRGAQLVQKGVSYWYFVACLFQSSWTFAFGYEIIPLSACCMAGILASLITIVVRQSKIDSEEGKRIRDFWLYKFPFSIHCGWIFAAFAVNVNVAVISTGAGVGTQTVLGYVTYAYVVLVAIFALAFLRPPDFTIPYVLVWASIGIISELGDPKEIILDTFEEDVISRFRTITIVIGAILATVTSAYAVIRIFKKDDKKDGEKDKGYEPTPEV